MNEYSRPGRPFPAVPAASPVMIQYHEIKEANPGCLLLFSDGGFLRAVLRLTPSPRRRRSTLR